MTRESEYTLASTDAERERLARQAAKLRPMTERLFQAAGISPGMAVLDVGSGAGDVALLAQSLVGAEGRVLGFDRDPQQVAYASSRAASTANVSFVTAEIDDPRDGEFDAVVGRLVLMYQRDLEGSLRTLASRLRPGGVMAFVENNNRGDSAPVIQWPAPSELELEVQGWISTAFNATDTALLVGLRLPGLFRAVGLVPQPPYDAGALIYEGREGAEMSAGLVRSMLPILEREGVDPSDIDIDTLAERMDREHGDGRIAAVGPLLAVWARKPDSAR